RDVLVRRLIGQSTKRSRFGDSPIARNPRRRNDSRLTPRNHRGHRPCDYSLPNHWRRRCSSGDRDMSHIETLISVTVPNSRYTCTTSDQFPGLSCVTVRLTRRELELAQERLNELERGKP